MKQLIISLIIIFTHLVSFSSDTRICGEVKRDSKGVIKRDLKVLRDFQYLYPCPSTGKTTGPCKNWAKDHVIPLACGGCDTIENMQWLPVEIKSCKEDTCKDRFERQVYQNKYC